MVSLTDKEQEYYDSQKKCYVRKKWFVYNKKMIIIKITKKLEVTVILQENLEGLLIAFVI